MNKILISLRQIWRCSFVIFSLILYVPFFHGVCRFLPQKREALDTWFYGFLCRLLGVKVEVSGTLSSHSPTIFVANHTSYLDILALGHVLPGSFVAKEEVASWPLVGGFAAGRNTVFISRAKGRTKDGLNQLTDTLKEGYNLILFPEGTTGDGLSVLPFRSSFFHFESPVFFQAVSLDYRFPDGSRLPPPERQAYAWYLKEQSLLPHLFHIARYESIKAIVVLHPPLPNTYNRKTLASDCYALVTKGLQ